MFYLWSFRWNSNRVNVQPQFHPEDTPMNAGIATCRSLIPLSCDRILDPESCRCVKHVIKPNNDITLNSFWGKCPHQKVWMNEKKWKCAVSRNTNAAHGHLLWPNWTANRKLESHLTGTDCVKWSLSKSEFKKAAGYRSNFHSAKRFATKEISFPFFGGSQLSVCLQVGSNVNLGGWNCAFSKFERFQPETGNYWANPAI